MMNRLFTYAVLTGSILYGSASRAQWSGDGTVATEVQVVREMPKTPSFIVTSADFGVVKNRIPGEQLGRCLNIPLRNKTNRQRLLSALSIVSTSQKDKELVETLFRLNAPEEAMMPVTVMEGSTFFVSVCLSDEAETMPFINGEYNARLVADFQGDTTSVLLHVKIDHPPISSKGILPSSDIGLETPKIDYTKRNPPPVLEVTGKGSKRTFNIKTFIPGSFNVLVLDPLDKPVMSFSPRELKAPGDHKIEFDGKHMVKDPKTNRMVAKPLPKGYYLVRLESFSYEGVPDTAKVTKVMKF